jgi:dGTPase
MNWNNLLNDNRLKPSSRNKTDDFRNEYESDYGRIIFSPAIRRMHDKTQVFPLTNDDNIHSRLTHSLEVMSVGESIALNIINNETLST